MFQDNTKQSQNQPYQLNVFKTLTWQSSSFLTKTYCSKRVEVCGGFVLEALVCGSGFDVMSDNHLCLSSSPYQEGLVRQILTASREIKGKAKQEKL